MTIVVTNENYKKKDGVLYFTFKELDWEWYDQYYTYFVYDTDDPLSIKYEMREKQDGFVVVKYDQMSHMNSEICRFFAQFLSRPITLI